VEALEVGELEASRLGLGLGFGFGRRASRGELLGGEGFCGFSGLGLRGLLKGGRLFCLGSCLVEGGQIPEGGEVKCLLLGGSRLSLLGGRGLEELAEILVIEAAGLGGGLLGAGPLLGEGLEQGAELGVGGFGEGFGLGFGRLEGSRFIGARRLDVGRAFAPAFQDFPLVSQRGEI
ncbi:MAG TPA: hypothetical protein VFL04_01925, partial [Rectinemataceae bacterium]|nr:hypothetical protein [Rectinemataceae bacterium]